MEQGTGRFQGGGGRLFLAEPLCSRCCFLIGNSASNKAFHLLSLVKCFHSISKWCNYPAVPGERAPERRGARSPCSSLSQQEARRRVSWSVLSFRNPNTIKWGGGGLHVKCTLFFISFQAPPALCVSDIYENTHKKHVGLVVWCVKGGGRCSLFLETDGHWFCLSNINLSLVFMKLQEHIFVFITVWAWLHF